MVDDHTLAEHEPGDTPAGGELIRGPWPGWTPEPPPPVSDEHRAWLAERARERAQARRERRSGTAAATEYQLLAMTIARAQRGDVVDVTNDVLERLARLTDDELRALIRQRLAGHRIR